MLQHSYAQPLNVTQLVHINQLGHIKRKLFINKICLVRAPVIIMFILLTTYDRVAVRLVGKLNNINNLCGFFSCKILKTSQYGKFLRKKQVF